MAQQYESIEDAKRRRGEKTTFVVLKVGTFKHMEELADGHLRFRRLSFYRAAENEGQPFYDKNEGLAGVYQPSAIRMTLRVDGEDHEVEGLVDQILVQRCLDMPIMCLYALECGEWEDRGMDEEDFPKILDSMMVPPAMEKVGDTVWVILNGTAFKERLAAAVKAQGLAARAARVTYVDFSRTHGAAEGRDHGFVKDARFQHEHEYRIAIYARQLLPDPFVLDLGSLRDISVVKPLSELRKSLSMLRT